MPRPTRDRDGARHHVCADERRDDRLQASASPATWAGEGTQAWAAQNLRGRRALLDAILAQVSREALAGDGLDAALRAIVAGLVRRLPVPVASIILLDDAGQHFIQEVAAGEFALALPTTWPWPVGVGAAGRCARLGTPVLIADVHADPDYVAGHPDVQSEYLVPIRHRQRLLGVLNLESTRADLFTAEFRSVFDAIADQVAGALHLALVVRELERANHRLQQWSMQDGLTGIANRRCFDLQLQRDWQRLADERRSLALLLVDVDSFKPLNDACGHLYGDECLRELARLCGQVADGAGDLVARYGGEEVAVLLPGRSLAPACRLAERLRRRVADTRMPHPASRVADHVTVSIGVGALRPRPSLSPERLIEAADAALYAAKDGGRDRVVGQPRRSPRDVRR